MECAISGCGRRAKSRGWCNRHYENWRRTGNPISFVHDTIAQRIARIGWTVTDAGCHEWNGTRNANGYAIMTLINSGLKDGLVHRVRYELTFGSVGALEVRHTCDNPPCIRLDHLIPGTHGDNMRDMAARGRQRMQIRTQCGNGHDLTTPGAKRKYADGSACVECRRDRTRRYESGRGLGRAAAQAMAHC